MRAIEIGAIGQWRHYQPNSPSFSPISRPRLAANRKEPSSAHCHLDLIIISIFAQRQRSPRSIARQTFATFLKI
jgi:hypothetical protein